jgi:hypothetical protein
MSVQHNGRNDHVSRHPRLTACAAFVFTLLATAPALADTQECVMKADASGDGWRVGKGERIYNRWANDIGLSLHVIANGQFKEVSGVDPALVDCKGAAGTGAYPVVFSGVEGRAQLAREFGILFDPAAVDKDRKVLTKLPHKCFYIGDGHVGMEISKDAFEPYAKQGFSLATLCLALTSGQIRFDPETGARLPTYVFADKPNPSGPAFISDEYPFFVPKCFGKGKTDVQPSRFSATMKPIGCTVNYHPWSGRKLNDDEVKFFTLHASLRAAGDAGTANEDSDNLAGDASRRLSAAKIEAIKQQAPKK